MNHAPRSSTRGHAPRLRTTATAQRAHQTPEDQPAPAVVEPSPRSEADATPTREARRPADQRRAALRLFGLKEAAEILGTDYREVRELVERGDLPCIPVGAGQEPRFSLCLLQAWQRHLARTGGLKRGGRRPA